MSFIIRLEYAYDTMYHWYILLLKVCSSCRLDCISICFFLSNRIKSQTIQVTETHLLCLLQISILDAPQANSWESHHSVQLEDPGPPSRVEPPGERTGFPPPELSSPQYHPCCSGSDPRELSPNALARPCRSQALETPSTPTGWKGWWDQWAQLSQLAPWAQLAQLAQWAQLAQ